MVGTVGLVGMATRAVETVGADTAFRQSDAFHHILKLAEPECGQAQTVGNLLHHTFILGCAGGGVKLKVGFVIPLEILMIWRVISSMSLLEEVNPMKGHP